MFLIQTFFNITSPSHYKRWVYMLNITVACWILVIWSTQNYLFNVYEFDTLLSVVVYDNMVFKMWNTMLQVLLTFKVLLRNQLLLWYVFLHMWFVIFCPCNFCLLCFTFTRELLQLIDTFTNVAGSKILKKSVALLLQMIKKLREKSEKHHYSQLPQIT